MVLGKTKEIERESNLKTLKNRNIVDFKILKIEIELTLEKLKAIEKSGSRKEIFQNNNNPGNGFIKVNVLRKVTCLTNWIL